MSWLNAEAARLLALKTFNPPHTHTHTDTQTCSYSQLPWHTYKQAQNSLSLAEEGKKWRRTCHTYFYRFHFNAEKANASRLKPLARPTFRSPIRCHAPAPSRCAGNVSLASALLACLHQIGKASSQPAKKRVHYGNLLKLVCLPMIGRGAERGRKRGTAGRGLRQFQVCVFFFGISQPLKSTQ